MPERPEPEPEVTTDLPGAGPSTARRHETSRRSDEPPLEGTGPYTPAGADASSVTGGYTPSDMPERPPGTPIVPGFEILDELGRGGMGVVYKARQVALGRVVALKMILAGGHAGEKDLLRFQAEAKAVAKFQHPNIVQIFEVGDAGGLPYFSLEFVSAGPLNKKIDHDPQSPKYAAEIVEALARAMQYAHERGIVHRDLKPANVLLAEDGTPKITDFGLAKQLEGDSGQTQSGQILGTPSFMAPEQAFGDSDKIGPPADVYALGGILYDLLTGRPPFAGSSVLDTLEMVRTREPVPPSELAGKMPRDIETIALKCLQKEPAKRYESAGALADDLHRYLENRPILARPVSSFEKGLRWAKRNPGVAGLGTTVAILLITVAVVTSVLSYSLSIKKKEAEESAQKEETAKIAALDARALEEVAKLKAIDEQKKAEKARAREEIAKKNAEDEQRKAEAAKKLQGELKTVALGTIRGVLTQVDEVMKNNVKLYPFRLEIIKKMLVDLDKISDKTMNDTLEDRTEAIAFTRIGQIYYDTGKTEKAAMWIGKGHDVLKVIADESPGDATALRNQAGVSHSLADAEWRLGKETRARELHAAALESRKKRLAILQVNGTPVNKGDATFDVADSYGLLAFTDLRLGDPESALKNYLESDRLFASLPAEWGRQYEIGRKRLAIQQHIGDAKMRLKQFDEAEKHYQKALDQRVAQLKITPKNTGYSFLLLTDIALSHLYGGDFLLMARNNVTAAAIEYERALVMFSTLLEEQKDNLELRQRVAAVHYRLGAIAGQRNGVGAIGGAIAETASGLAHYTESLRLRDELAKIDPTDAPAQVEKMLVLARLGRMPEVEKIAAQLRKTAGNERQVLFQLACALSIASTGKDEAGKRCGDESLKVLHKLVDQGWKDRITLETDPDLADIRKDGRFKDVLKRMTP